MNAAGKKSSLEGDDAWEPAAGNPHVFRCTNRPSAPSQGSLPPDTKSPGGTKQHPSSVTVILLDAFNTAAADQTLAHKQVIRVLQEIHPQEYVALYWLGNRLQILHDFTTDGSALRQVLAAFGSKSNRELDNSELADPRLAGDSATSTSTNLAASTASDEF